MSTAPQDDPLAGTPGGATPPQPPPYQAPYRPPYGYYGPPPSQDEGEFSFHWPKSRITQAGIVVLAVVAGWMFVDKQFEQFGGIVGIIMMMLGIKKDVREQTVTVARSFAAASAQQHAALGHLAHDVHITKETVRSIANDPEKPGTPGTMERLEGGGKPPFANL